MPASIIRTNLILLIEKVISSNQLSIDSNKFKNRGPVYQTDMSLDRTATKLEKLA